MASKVIAWLLTGIHGFMASIPFASPLTPFCQYSWNNRVHESRDFSFLICRINIKIQLYLLEAKVNELLFTVSGSSLQEEFLFA